LCRLKGFELEIRQSIAEGQKSRRIWGNRKGKKRGERRDETQRRLVDFTREERNKI
jgi:hypothetical protein